MHPFWRSLHKSTASTGLQNSSAPAAPHSHTHVHTVTVCDVIAQLGSQAPIQHQTGLVLLAGSKASQRPSSCKSVLALTSALHKPACTRPLAAMVRLHHLYSSATLTSAMAHAASRRHACICRRHH